jgi:hypothetical protein
VGRRLISAALIVVAVLAVPDVSAAQGYPAGNLSVSYAALKDSDVDGMFGTGWAASVAGALTRSVELAGEVGGNYKTSTAPGVGAKMRLDLHSFLGGARYVARPQGRVSGFVQTLAGATRISAGFTSCGSVPPSICSEMRQVGMARTYFTLQPGAGVDVGMTNRVGIRVQGDYRAIFAGESGDSETLHEFRFAAGVVVGFGRRKRTPDLKVGPAPAAAGYSSNSAPGSSTSSFTLTRKRTASAPSTMRWS